MNGLTSSATNFAKRSARPVAESLAMVDLSPLQGVTPGPVTVAGYEEPSIVFLLGTNTELGDADDAATAIVERAPLLTADQRIPRSRAVRTLW